jgi:hypothetical protein
MRRFIKIIVVAALATAALTGPAAAQDYRSPDARDGAQPARSIIDLRSPDARDAAHASDIAQMSDVSDLRSPDARDTSGVSTYAPGFAPAPSVVQVPVDGFQWGDAGIGAAAMLGLIALCGGTLLVLSERRRHRRMPRAT